MAGDPVVKPQDDPATMSRLKNLAEKFEPTSQARVLDTIAELFTHEDARLSDHERSLMESILRKLVQDLEMRLRRELASRLEAMQSAPKVLVAMLANDDIEVARPLLMASPVLRDPDLIEIVKHRSQEHLLAIALRRPLNTEVTDALVDYGNEDVLSGLLKNPDAVLSRRAFDYLVAESKRVDRFQEPLLARDDLPTDLAARMFWFVSAALRQTILKRFEVDSALLDDVLQDLTKDAIARSTAPTAWSEASRLVAAAEPGGGHVTDKFLVQMLRADKVTAFLAGLAQRCGVSQRIAQRIFFDSGGEALAIACRGIGMDRASFSAIFLLSRQGRQRARSPQELQHSIAFFDSVSQLQARNVLRYWAAEPAYLEAIGKLPQGNDGNGTGKLAPAGAAGVRA